MFFTSLAENMSIYQNLAFLNLKKQVKTLNKMKLDFVEIEKDTFQFLLAFSKLLKLQK